MKTYADNSAVDILIKNKQKYGVSYTKQLSHGMRVFLLLPAIGIMGSLSDKFSHVAFGVFGGELGAIISFVGIFGGAAWFMRHFLSDMDRTDPVEKAKRARRPQLYPGRPQAVFHIKEVDERPVIVQE